MSSQNENQPIQEDDDAKDSTIPSTVHQTNPDVSSETDNTDKSNDKSNDKPLTQNTNDQIIQNNVNKTSNHSNISTSQFNMLNNRVSNMEKSVEEWYKSKTVIALYPNQNQTKTK